MELNERVADRIGEIQRANALKSQQKIKQLAAEHAKNKTPNKKEEDPDAIMDSDSEPEEAKEERPAKKNGKNGKNGKKTGQREPLERQPSKGTVVASKLANKRQQKEAIKKIKMKRNKGTVKETEEAAEATSPPASP